MIGLLSVLLLLCPSHSFNTVCPSAGQWYLRGGVKCTSEEQYTCLPDFNDHIYNESCSGPKGALQGERIVISNKNLDIKPCNAERYQPDLFSTNQGSACLFQKGNCSEEGLVIYSNGTSEMDRTCRCDYSRGFAFVSSNRTDPCSCNAATEDCSCYKKECNVSQVLSSDYQCIEQYMATQSTCPEIPDTINRDLNESSIQSENTTEVKLQGSCDIHCRIAFTITLIVCVIVWWFLFMIQEYLTAKLKIIMNWNPPVVILRDLPNEVKIGDEVIIECTAISVSHFQVHSYICYASNRFGDSERKQTDLKVTGDPPVVILRDLPNEVKIGDKVIIECTAISVSHFQVHWLKVTNEIKTEITPEVGDEKYGHFTEKMPSLVIKNVEESDDASYICYASNRFGDSERKQTDLKVTGDVITSELKETLCIECQDITFFCEVYANNLEVKWFKEEEEITKTNDKYIIDSKDKVHKLTVKQVVLQDAGNYCILVKDKRSTASLIVLVKMSGEESNFFHISSLLERVAVPLVRIRFDEEFNPKRLANTLLKEMGTLKKLNDKGIIGHREYATLFPRKDIYTVRSILLEKKYTRELGQKGNSKFKSLASVIEQRIENKMSDVKGKQEVNVLKFHSTYIVRLEVTADTTIEEIRRVMSAATKKKNIGQFPVCESEFLLVSNGSLCTVDVMFIDLNTNDAEKLDDKFSPEFERLSKEIVAAISKLFFDEEIENVSITVRTFKEDCLATTIEFKTEVFYKIDEIRAMIELEVEGSLLPNLNGIKVLSIKLKYEHLVPSSQNFSMRLMICLLRNLADYRKVDKSSAIDLERITKCRNEIAHIPVSHISEEKYGEMLDILTEALQRLGGSKYFTLVNKLDLIMKKSTSQEVFLRKLKTNLDSTLESVPENDQLDYDEDLNSGSESERKQLNLKLAFLLNRLVERVTRELFNKEFPPKQLAETIKKKQGKLLDLKKKKKLTQTQCMSLFPSTGGSPSSEKFEFALMVRLVWEFHEKEEYITKEMYCDLQELERLTDSLKKLNYSQIEMAKIVKILKGLGVMEYLQIIP